MKTELRSKIIDGLLSAVIMMVVMYPLIILLRSMKEWGTTSYWFAVLTFLLAGIWMLYRATQEKLSEIGRAWYGIIGALFAWTTTELSHELGMIDIENFDILIVLAVLTGFLTVMWKYFPVGARFWIMMFMMNWVGHVYIHVGEELLGTNTKMLFTASAAAYGLLLIGSIYWIFARSSTRVQRLWAALWIWHALAMIFFLMR